MLTLASADGRNMYVWRQLTLGAIAKHNISLPKALLQRSNSRWVALAANDPLGGSNADVSQDETVRHVETTLARSLFNCDEL